MSRFAPHVSSRPRALISLAVLGALTAATLLASPKGASAAQPADAALQTTVQYSMRDLSTDEATHALYQRIVSAARTVCPGYDSRDLAQFAASRTCQRQAVAQAISQIGDARLAALHVKKPAHRG